MESVRVVPTRLAAHQLLKLATIVFLAVGVLFALPAGVSFAETTEQAASSDVDEAKPDGAGIKQGLVKESGDYRYYAKGKLLKNRWKNVGDSRYYFNAKGNAVAGRSRRIGKKYYIFSDKGILLTGKGKRIVKLKSGVYYVNKKGRPAAKGWVLRSSRLYCVRVSGRCVTGKKVDGLVLASNGVAEAGAATNLKIAVMTHLKGLTKPSWSKTRKLRACYKYCLRVIRQHFTMAVKSSNHIGKRDSLQAGALVLLSKNKGYCFNFSAAFSAFAYELGYDPKVYEAAKHSYVQLGSKAYDSGCEYYSAFFGGEPRLKGIRRCLQFKDYATTKSLKVE